MSTKSSIPIKPIDFDLAKRAVEEFVVERNVPSQVYPKSVEREGEGAAPVIPRAPSRKFTVDLPDYVIDAIAARALQARPRQTGRYVILEALKAIGIHVEDADLVKDGRRRLD